MLNTIKFGDTGNTVKVAQYLTLFCAIGEATSNFDASFESHIKTYQSEHNLEADGIIGKKTWAAILNELPTCSTSKQRTSVYTCAIQIMLNNLIVDGIYGNNTKKAVAAYQSAVGLVADGICGPKTWAKLIAGETDTTSDKQVTTGNKVLNNCVKYLQWDSKWKTVKYSTHTSSQTIGNSGCGPTSMAMIMATFIDPKITPVEMCKLAVDNGYRTYNSGTAWGFYKYVFKKYSGFTKYVETNSVETLKAALREGALAVCSMNNNDNCFWSRGGHFIVARGCDDTYIYANDPNKSETPRRQASNKFQSCMKQAFIFWKADAKKEDNNNNEFNLNPSGKIVDISKWDGNINFDEFKNAASLVIARAASGSDPDPYFDTYVKSMIERKMPFGVYGYSYAGTEEKARDEARKIYEYASKYNPLFYVYDIEETKNTKAAILAWVDEIRKLGAKCIGAYVGQSYYLKFNFAEIKKLFDFIWIPRYGLDDGDIPSEKYRPKYECDLWQYTSAGSIAGIRGNVDLSIITGQGHDYNWFITRKN